MTGGFQGWKRALIGALVPFLILVGMALYDRHKANGTTFSKPVNCIGCKVEPGPSYHPPYAAPEPYRGYRPRCDKYNPRTDGSCR